MAQDGKTSIRNRSVFRYLRVALLLWGVGVSVAAVEPDHDRVTAAAAGGVVATDASRQKSAAAAAVGPVRTWHQSLLRPTYQPSVDGDGAVDTQILRSLHK